MKYYEAKIIRPMFKGNYTQGKKTTVFIAVKKTVSNDLLKDFNWVILYIHQIPSYKYALYLLTKTVTNHDNCFDYLESVVIE